MSTRSTMRSSTRRVCSPRIVAVARKGWTPHFHVRALSVMLMVVSRRGENFLSRSRSRELFPSAVTQPTGPPAHRPRLPVRCRQLYVCEQTSFIRGLHNCTSCNGVARTRRYPVETPRYFIQLRLCMILYDQIALQTARPTLPRCVSGVEPCINRPTHLSAQHISRQH